MQCPPLHFAVIAIEKGTSGSPSTKVASVTYQGMEQRPPLYLAVIAIEKGAFESSSTKVPNFTCQGVE